MYGVANKAVLVAAVAASALDLTGKTVAVIGGTSGLGRALALFAASKGATVTVVGRSFKARAAARVGPRSLSAPPTGRCLHARSGGGISGMRARYRCWLRLRPAQRQRAPLLPHIALHPLAALAKHAHAHRTRMRAWPTSASCSATSR
jgi:NAD(P)-dependent dehydrogenase (short-subunit alcohol dehydrogenase family)